MADDVNKEEDTAEVLAELENRSDEDLKSVLDELYHEEARLSYRRRVLHARIDLVREELVRRLKADADSGKPLFGPEDIDRLSEILTREGIGRNSFSHVDAGELGDEDIFR